MHVEMSALAALTTEKDIHLEELIYAIEVAVLGAYNQTETAKRHARAHLDRETGEITILVKSLVRMELVLARKLIHLMDSHEWQHRLRAR